MTGKYVDQVEFKLAYHQKKSKRKAMNMSWSNQKSNSALKTRAGNKKILQMDKIQ